MGRLHYAAFGAALASLALSSGCSGSSSSGGGSGCINLTGTYHSTSHQCSDGSPDTGDNTVIQTGCAATVMSGGQSVTGTVVGNKVTIGDETCTISINGTAYTSDCSYKNGQGVAVTCHDVGTISPPTNVTGGGGTANGTGGDVTVGAGGSITGAGGSFGAGGFASGGFPSGGAAGGPGGGAPNACETGAAAVCTCLEGTSSPCVSGEPASLASSCASQNPANSFVACYAGFVSGGQVACGLAAQACLSSSGGAPGAGGAPSTCDPGTGRCTTCVATNCCAEFNACGADPLCGGASGELSCMQACLIDQIQTAGVADIQTCATSCAAGGIIAPATNDLLTCMIGGSTGTGCSVECFGAQI